MFKRAAVLTTVVLIVLAASAAPARSEESAPAAPPLMTPDTDLLKRTPVIDGAVEDGEWDRFYSYCSGDWDITTYANWDSGNLYVAAKSNKAIDFLCVLDANADGWFHGDENFEFRAVRAQDDGLTLTVCRYESRNIKSPVATPVTGRRS